ncbi:MAG: hypothetical protein JJT90_12440 [Ectothiorhodospiraceae bacterium]|nr:hypothetical protein [Ectothiorhodospiraceae bacterium]
MDLYGELRRVQQHAYEHASAIREIYDNAGMKPDDLRGADALSKLPVTKKEALLDRQREHPPFGGFLAARPEEIGRIFISPGPIHEPQLRTESTGHGFAEAFRAFGIGPGDVVLNTWAYHMVPAGLLLDDGLRAAGATVVPAGTGASELQAKLILDLQVTSICASTGYFLTLIEKLEEMGASVPGDWAVRTALLGGEFGDWIGKRRRLEERYRIKTFAVYATGDLGVVAYETQDGNDDYAVHPERIVQICDPVTGSPLPIDSPGEIVVTTLAPGWPLIRFGTGDVAAATAVHADGTAARIGMLQGRVGQAVKAREIFLYPRQIEDIAIRIADVRNAQVIVSRPGTRDEITLRLELEKTATTEPETLKTSVGDVFRELTRLRADHIEFVEDGGFGEEFPLLIDKKDP